MGLFTKKESVELIEKTFNVQGMMCSHCEMNAKKSLLGVPGVKEASASSVLKKVCVKVTPEVTDDMIREAIASAGYTVVD